MSETAERSPRARNGWRAVWIGLGLASAACDGFEIPTRPDYGFVRVVVTTSGGDLDSDGYSVFLDNSQFKLVKDTAVESFYVRSGEHTVSLTALADNCTVTGPASQTVSVAQGEVASVTFDVVCLATGIAVTTRTTGSDWPSKLQLVVDIPPPVLIPANGAQTIGRLRPGTHQLTVQPPRNCTVAGDSSMAVVVAASEVTNVALAVSCTRVDRPPRIAYSVDWGVNPTVRQIELVNVDGSEAKRLQLGDAPAWSRDGTQLAFSDAFCPGGWYSYYYYCTGGIIVADPEIGDVTTLVGGANGAHPTWSPSGSAIVFENIASAPDLVLDVLGTLTHSLARVIIEGPRSTSQAAWSPDGARIAFVCRWPSRIDICVANADGTAPMHLTDDEQPDQEPAWSPDGTKLAFARYPVGAFNAASASIAVMDLTTRQFTLIGPGGDPSWSPDGSKLVVEGIDGLFVMNADGSGRARLTTGPHHAPAWRP